MQTRATLRAPWVHAVVAVVSIALPAFADDRSADRRIAYELLAPAVDPELAARIEVLVAAGVEHIEAFFGRPFEHPFTVTVAPDRAAFDRWFPEAWGMTPTQCWMVASGVDTGLVLLSPRAWSAQACEHDPDDATHLRNLLVHELVHTYHGQVHESGDFDFPGAEEIAWFLEGLATYASGQLAEGHVAEAAEALAAGEGPASLATAWSGRYRYGVSGSLVRFVDRAWGRETLCALLTASSQEEILRRLGVGEADLLARWRRSVAP